MANEENLKPLNKRTKSEQREIAKKGGKASGKSRRKKANLKKAFETILESEVHSRQHEEALLKFGYDTRNEMALALVIMGKAMKGDIRAFEQIAKIVSVKDDIDIKEQKERIKFIKTQRIEKESNIAGNSVETKLDDFLKSLEGAVDD